MYSYDSVLLLQLTSSKTIKDLREYIKNMPEEVEVCILKTFCFCAHTILSGPTV